MTMTENKDILPILSKFDIVSLNTMQEEAYKVIKDKKDLVLISPTGTGKTLAFLLPLIGKIDIDCTEIQVLILVPSRELAQQIEQVVRQMGAGIKVNSVYGGRSGMQDRLDLRQRPAILIGTPGRVADRIRRDGFSLEYINTLVLDEFDKSLEIGFEKEMTEIVESLPNVSQRILTSATSDVEIPAFVGLHKPVFAKHIHEDESKLKIEVFLSTEKDKLPTLANTLRYIGAKPGVVFCNFKDAIDRVSSYLTQQNINHECFHGGMEQMDREKALIKFRNGTSQLLLATDLAARGLDIPEIEFIIHYHLPPHEKEFIHRNGRTARMNRNGTAYILQWEGEELPDFIKDVVHEKLYIKEQSKFSTTPDVRWKTLYITGGRRDKISKGDVAGLIFKQGGIKKEQLGIIEVKQDCTYVGVHSEVAYSLMSKINNSRLKKKKVRVSLI